MSDIQPTPEETLITENKLWESYVDGYNHGKSISKPKSGTLCEEVKKDAISIAYSTASDPERIARTRGLQLGWSTIAGCLINARFKLERFIGQEPSGEFVVWPKMACVKLAACLCGSQQNSRIHA